ncbi:MAG: mechanosensitive ion channel family protein [bacterium]|nr:mechanosensitive ion channel family protein [bacterium]MCX7917296.1 mechanosensitive ion channel family protein [bacterium]MDW8163593.1 mechanosensitive ion channel [Candidatus Omnitrophota bacterium]
MIETLKNNILTLIYFFVIIFLCFLTSWVWNFILLRITKEKKLYTKILKRIKKGVISFIFFSGISILWERVSTILLSDNIYFEKLSIILPKIIYSFIVFSIAFIFSKIVDGFVEWYLEEIPNRTKAKVDEEFMRLLQKVSRIIIFFIAITIILNKFNQPITSILGAAGIASFAVAFAAQDTLSNMISGFFIMIDKPFRIGDRIKLATGEIGEVIDIGIRRTKILSPENNIVIISNSEIVKTRIINLGFPDTIIKINLKIAIQTFEDKEKIKDILIEICKKNPKIIKDTVNVYLVEFTNLQSCFILSFSIDYKDEMEVIDRMIDEIRKKFLEEKIELISVKRE